MSASSSSLCIRSSVSWKHVSLQLIKLFTFVYAAPFLFTYVPSFVSLAARRFGSSSSHKDPKLPVAVVLSIQNDNDTDRRQHYSYVLIPTLLQDRSFRVAWSVDSMDHPPDMVSALHTWEKTTQVTTTTTTSSSHKALPDIKLTETNDTEWCLSLPSHLGKDGSSENICRTGSLDGEYSAAASTTHHHVQAHVSILVSNLHSQTFAATSSSGVVTAGGFRRNPNKHKPSLVDRLHPILTQASFGLLAGLQLYLFVVYWNGNVSPSTVGKSFANIWQSGEVWRALSGSTAHFDLWHIGLNLSAFYQLSQALQHSMPPIVYLGLNLSFMAWVSVFWVFWQQGRQRIMHSDPSASLNSVPTIGYSGVLFALSTIVTLQRHESCPIPFVESICFSTHHFGGLAFSFAPLIQLGMVQVILPRVSFAGHLAGIVVGFLYISGMLPWSAYPSFVWTLWHFVYLVGIAPYASSSGDQGRRLRDARSWVSTAVAAPGMRIALVACLFSGFTLGWMNPLVWSYVLTALFWLQSTLSSEGISIIWKRAFCVYAIVLLITHAVTVGAWALLPRAWMTISGLVAVSLQGLTLWGGLLHCLDDVRNTEGIFRNTLGWTILQPLSHLQSTWRTLRRLEAAQAVRSFPGEGRRLREVETELV